MKEAEDRMLENAVGKRGVKTYKYLSSLSDGSWGVHKRAEFCLFQVTHEIKHRAVELGQTFGRPRGKGGGVVLSPIS